MTTINGRLKELMELHAQAEQKRDHITSIRRRIRQEEAACAFLEEERDRVTASLRGLRGVWKRALASLSRDRGSPEEEECELQVQLDEVTHTLQGLYRELAAARSEEKLWSNELAEEQADLLGQRRQLLLSLPEAPHALLEERAEVVAGVANLQPLIDSCRQASLTLDGVAKPILDAMNPQYDMNRIEKLMWPDQQRTNALDGATLARGALRSLQEQLQRVGAEPGRIAALELSPTMLGRLDADWGYFAVHTGEHITDWLAGFSPFKLPFLRQNDHLSGFHDGLSVVQEFQEAVADVMQLYLPQVREREARLAEIDRALDGYVAEAAVMETEGRQRLPEAGREMG